MTAGDRGGQDLLDVEDRFAVVPEWLLDAAISDCAVRLYAVLLRFGQSSGARMPSRSTLAGRLHKRSSDTVDRAMRELVELGAVAVQARFAGRERLTNLYRVRTSRPAAPPPIGAAVADLGGPAPAGGGGRNSAATPTSAAGRSGAASRTVAARGGRTDAATVAANVRHNPEFSTESENPPPPSPTVAAATAAHTAEPAATPPVAAECAIDDWAGFVADCGRRRRALGQPVTRWAGPCLDAALQLAVRGRGWPAQLAPRALLLVAADPGSRSPMRLAEAGPWWDTASTADSPTVTKEEVQAAESELEAAGGLRVRLQQQARAQLTADGQPVTRATVALGARDLLHELTARADS